jgi:phosphatidate cytidylyltransferase
MKNIIKRTLTGIVYLFVVGFAFYLSGWVLVAVFTIFLVVATMEYINLAQQFPIPKGSMQRLVQKQILPLVWILFPVLLLEYWCIILNANNIMVALFVILCLNDTMAFVFGSLFGKHKMWLKVSPKKSWEGFIGGLISTMVASWFLVHIPYFHNEVFINQYIWTGFALILIIAGTFGDFAESMVKRLANQKDSGSILPGHGGVLDRIDSMLFAVPAGFIYWVIVGVIR